MLSNKYVDAIDYFDIHLGRINEQYIELSGHPFYDKSFLNYIKEVFLVYTETEDSEMALHEFRSIFGEGVMYYDKVSAVEVVNFLLKEKNQPTMDFEVEDTIRFGVHPSWFDNYIKEPTTRLGL